MAQSLRRRIFKWASITGLFLLTVWMVEYINRSFRGSYHQHSTLEGVAIAVWHPTDFTPRRLAPERPLDTQPSRKRYAPNTELPSKRYLDFPLLYLDRWIFHPTTVIQSGQGDMPYLYRISTDGRELLPVKRD